VAEPIEKAVRVASGISAALAGVVILSCAGHIGDSDFDMMACALPAIPQVAVPNISLILVLALGFAGWALWSALSEW
jgi:hypothetical protein